MLSKMIKPKRILEIGTYTGYSALCWAEGLQSNGELHTIDINEELEELVRSYIDKAGQNETVKFHIGDAKEIIGKLGGQFDIVYLDADKEGYALYYDMVFDQVPIGGYIIADNVLWSGNVIKPTSDHDLETKAIVAYNKKIHDDKRVENVLFPIRDGLMIARKIHE